jgi:thiol:disulfide interchange protein
MVASQSIQTVIIPLISFAKHGVLVKLAVKYGEAGETWITARFDPLDGTDYLYSQESPMEGINGIGRPTRLELSGDITLKGAVETSVPSVEKRFDDIAGEFTVYPPGQVLLSQPVEFADVPIATFDIAVTYMSCSNLGVCRPPVVRQTLQVRYDPAARKVKGLVGIPEQKFDMTGNPANALKAAIADATKTNRRIIIKIGGDWCIWCHRMDAFLHNNAELDSLLNDNFIMLNVNYSPENKNEAFLAQYPTIAGYPHLFVLDSDGKLLHSQDTSLLEDDLGYDHVRMQDFLKTWSIRA